MEMMQSQFMKQHSIAHLLGQTIAEKQETRWKPRLPCPTGKLHHEELESLHCLSTFKHQLIEIDALTNLPSVCPASCVSRDLEGSHHYNACSSSRMSLSNHVHHRHHNGISTSPAQPAIITPDRGTHGPSKSHTNANNAGQRYHPPVASDGNGLIAAAPSQRGHHGGRRCNASIATRRKPNRINWGGRLTKPAHGTGRQNRLHVAGDGDRPIVATTGQRGHSDGRRGNNSHKTTAGADQWGGS